jgi:hypothetical protein
MMNTNDLLHDSTNLRSQPLRITQSSKAFVKNNSHLKKKLSINIEVDQENDESPAKLESSYLNVEEGGGQQLQSFDC